MQSIKQQKIDDILLEEDVQREILEKAEQMAEEQRQMGESEIVRDMQSKIDECEKQLELR